jgi:hypothetical protein
MLTAPKSARLCEAEDYANNISTATPGDNTVSSVGPSMMQMVAFRAVALLHHTTYIYT